MNPDNTVFDAKRLIGRRFDDPSVQSDMKLWPFKIINDGGKPKIRVDYKSETKTFFAEEISSMVLVKMKEIAEAYLGKVPRTIFVWYFSHLLFCIYIVQVNPVNYLYSNNES